MDDAVVDLVGGNFKRRAAGVLAGSVGELEGIHLEVAKLDRVGIVGLERWAGVGGYADKEYTEGHAICGAQARCWKS